MYTNYIGQTGPKFGIYLDEKHEEKWRVEKTSLSSILYYGQFTWFLHIRGTQFLFWKYEGCGMKYVPRLNPLFFIPFKF